MKKIKIKRIRTKLKKNDKLGWRIKLKVNKFFIKGLITKIKKKRTKVEISTTKIIK